MFADQLLAWFDARRRDLPWRTNRTPYRTWVSEVMLQQTTVDVVTPRFVEFLERFPDLQSLARAEQADVVAAWAGLGYYRRARGLHAGARAVMDRFAGEIPRETSDLLAIPGIGAYTAAAIRSLAFGILHPAIDGNVARVGARLFADDGEPTSVSTRKRIEHGLRELGPSSRAGDYTEALIELGALVCRPNDPPCSDCPVASHCEARRLGRVDELPRMKPRQASRAVVSSRAWVERDGSILLVRRPSDASLLPGFLELPGRWGPEGEDPASVVAEVLDGLGFGQVVVAEPVAEARHSITRNRIRSIAVRARVEGRTPPGPAFLKWDDVDPETLTTETRKLMRAREANS